jgi:predicted PurR-regulated permease PerM
MRPPDEQQPTAPPAVTSRAQHYVLLALAVGAIYVLGRLLWPFLTAIVISSVVAILLHPLYRRFARRLRNADIAALIGTTVAFFLFMVPVALITIGLLQELQARVGTDDPARLLAPDGRLADWVGQLGALFGLDPGEISEAVAQQVQQVGGFLLGRTLALISGIGGWLLQAGAALFTLFYLLRDGERLVSALKWFVPLAPEQTERLFKLARDAIHATVVGNLVVAIVQGVAGGIVFALLGIPGAMFWGLVMGMLSLLPVVGPFFVWMPAAVLLFIAGRIAAAIILIVTGVLLISMIDNVLRPVLISGRAQLHPLAVFFSILGGVFVFGAIGLLLGPVLFVIALTVLEMARLALGGEALPPLASGGFVAPGETAHAGFRMRPRKAAEPDRSAS